jgi:hypothetical protein
VENVSLTMIDRGHPQTEVFTGQLAVDLDERQYELPFCPCLDAATTGETIVVDTSSVDSPYREFARIAARAGVRQVVAVGLPLKQRSIGDLDIYRCARADTNEPGNGENPMNCRLRSHDRPTRWMCTCSTRAAASRVVAEKTQGSHRYRDPLKDPTDTGGHKQRGCLEGARLLDVTRTECPGASVRIDRQHSQQP